MMPLRFFIFLSAVLPALFTSCAPDAGIRRLPPVTSIGAPDFKLASGNILGAGYLAGNRVRTLQNGNQIFPAMLAAIRSARSTITFETYVFEDGEIAQAFAQALAERARAGVRVLAIIDGFGGKKSRKYDRMMEQAGVKIARYNRTFLPSLRYNNRTHRKLLVVDGRVAYIGGVGVASEWTGNAQDPDHWRDNHYEVRGPVVAQAQAAFADNWLKAKREILLGPSFYPRVPAAGSTSASLFYASPNRASFNVAIAYHVAISSAKKSILIENAYFVPDKDTVRALADAAKRGVDVRIIVPGPNIDQPKVRRASRKRWKDLLDAGARVYEYQPTMLHSKLMIVDGLFVSVGSANFDNRSLHLNDEANLNVMDRSFAAEQTRIFENDLKQSKEMTLENYRDVPMGEKIMGWLQGPIEGQL